MRYDRSANDGKVISLPERADGRIATRPIAPQAALEQPLPRDALGEALDALLLAQFELCGHDPHPTRASLSEMRFRQARESLDAGIAKLKRLAEGADLPASIDPPAQPHEDDVYAAD
jgi:hypothetical protein